jgi:hypothetical protein
MELKSVKIYDVEVGKRYSLRRCDLLLKFVFEVEKIVDTAIWVNWNDLNGSSGVFYKTDESLTVYEFPLTSLEKELS